MKAEVNRVKNVSGHRKWEYWYRRGIYVRGPDGKYRVLRGQELEDYTNEQIWRDGHPDQEPIQQYELEREPKHGAVGSGNPGDCDPGLL